MAAGLPGRPWRSRTARKLFEGVAPEHKEELSELWKTYSLRFNILTNAGPNGLFVLDAGALRDARFNHRAMRAFWLALFVAWKGYRDVADGCEADNIDLVHFRDMVKCFSTILTEDDPEAVPLPDGIPDPGTFPDGAESHGL